MAFLDETGLAELWSLVKAEDAKVLAADVKIVTGTYTGTGKNTSSNYPTLTFEREPLALFIGCDNGSAGTNYAVSGAHFLNIIGETVQYGDSNSGQYFTLLRNGNTIGWYSGQDSDAAKAMNSSKYVYHYTALI